MKVKVYSLLAKRDTNISTIMKSDNTFRVKEIKFNVAPNTLEKGQSDSDILKCLKYCIKENKNTIDYLEVSELIDTGNIIGNNFWNEKYFESTCRFEFRDYFDLENCKIIYKHAV